MPDQPDVAITTRGKKLTLRLGSHSMEVRFSDQSSLISPGGRAAIRITGDLLRTSLEQTYEIDTERHDA